MQVSSGWLVWFEKSNCTIIWSATWKLHVLPWKKHWYDTGKIVLPARFLEYENIICLMRHL